MSDGGLDSFWSSLRRAEHRFEAEAAETERELYRTVYGYKSRVMRLRSALAKSGSIAFQTVTTKLQGIKLDAIWGILFAAVRDMALYYGGSVVLGTAIGAGLGSLAFGVGAIPGAAIGAEAGNVVGEWVLMYLGLKMLAEGLVNTIPPALRLYVQGFRLAWGPVESDRPDARYSADYHHGEDMAAHRFADGHVLMIMAILMAIVAYLTRGKSEEALMQAVRKSERLGAKMADWLADNRERLLKAESLKPKVQPRPEPVKEEAPRSVRRSSPAPKPKTPAVRSNTAPPKFDPTTVKGPFSLLNQEYRPVTYDQFVQHVNDTGLNNAFSKPLSDVYTDVYAVPKDLRPPPSSYLTDEFMASHTAQFLPGAARVDATASFNGRYLRDIEAGLPFGRTDAVFTSPASLIDNLYATGDPAVMESTLGFPAGTFSEAGSMTRTYISNPEALGLRFAQGTEGGANPYWVPGGYTLNTNGGAGLPEMVTDQLPSPLVNPNVTVLQ